MASIIKRGPYQFQAQVRRKGYPTQTKTFESHKAALDWSTTVEAEMTNGNFVDRSALERTTFGDLLERYERDETPHKRGWEAELVRIRALKKHALAARPLSTLRKTDFAKYRDERLENRTRRTTTPRRRSRSGIAGKHPVTAVACSSSPRRRMMPAATCSSSLRTSSRVSGRKHHITLHGVLM